MSAAPRACEADVVIIGGGPAGCAAAITLATFAPSLSVRLVTMDAPVLPRGEHVPPPIRNLLTPLGLWDVFLRDGHRPSSGHDSAWGRDACARHDGIFRTDRVGWQLDRTRFDGMLRRAAGEAVPVEEGRLHRAAPADAGLDLVLESGRNLRARFALDASGRAAVLARALGVRPTLRDRLTAVVAALPAAGHEVTDLAIESVRYGWWYASTPPAGPRIVACMTDSDQIRALDLRDPAGFMALLRQTRHLGCDVARTLEQAPVLCPAQSSHVSLPADLPILAVGDAAGARDPLIGAGLCRALRSGIHAAYAIGDWLGRGDARGLHRCRALGVREEASDRAGLRAVYGQETRWPDHAFWRRRMGSPEGSGSSTRAERPVDRAMPGEIQRA